MMQACSVAGCHERTEGGPCSVHRREANRARGSASQRGYDIAWRRLRAAFLKARCEACGEDPNGNCEQCRGTGLANRFCADCLRAGLMVLAEEVHHIESIRRRLDLRLVWSNLMALCGPCHDIRTRNESREGYRGYKSFRINEF
jgi:5-methylcytosine-specific restriction enzyme A